MASYSAPKWWLPAPSILVVLALVLVWEVVVRWLSIPTYILPTPSSIIAKMAGSINVLLINAQVTFFEAFGGLSIAFVIGVSTAFLFQIYPKLDEAGQPLIAGFQSFPKEAIAPLLVVWFGFGMTSKLIIASSIAFFPIFLSTLKGLKAVPDEVVHIFSSLRASKWQILLKARVPYSLPFMFSGIRVASTLSVVGAVIGEFVGSSAGLGHLILVANSQFSVDLVFGCLIMLGVMGIVADTLIKKLERKLVPWHESIYGYPKVDI